MTISQAITVGVGVCGTALTASILAVDAFGAELHTRIRCELLQPTAEGYDQIIRAANWQETQRVLRELCR